jgi:hypothetical protein
VEEPPFDDDRHYIPPELGAENRHTLIKSLLFCILLPLVSQDYYEDSVQDRLEHVRFVPVESAFPLFACSLPLELSLSNSLSRTLYTLFSLLSVTVLPRVVVCPSFSRSH